jgi:hypothetical protein
MDEGPEPLPSPGMEISRSMNAILRSDMTRVDVFQVFAPEKEEAFVTCLMAELVSFFTSDNADIQRNALKICDVLLTQRHAIMKDLLMPEVKDRKSKEKRQLDVYTKGFAQLNEPHTTAAFAADDDSMANVKFRRFIFWLTGQEVAEEVQQVFKSIQEKATEKLGDKPLPTPDVISTLQANKVGALSTPVLAPMNSNRIRIDPVAKAQENFLTFYQYIIRSGLADIANGSVHWKACMNSLQGIGSIWEGVELPDEQEDGWPAASAEFYKQLGQGVGLRWKLDMTEGPERTRRRLKRNHEFAEIYTVLKRPAVSPQRLPATPTTGEGSPALVPIPPPETPRHSSEEAVKATAGDFDLRATAKLIKQVALVRKNSKGADEDEVRGRRTPKLGAQGSYHMTHLVVRSRRTTL